MSDKRVQFDDHYLGGIEERVGRDMAIARYEGAKVVGVYCAFTPKELIAAAGAIPVALCSGSDIPIQLAEQHLPRNLCALIKSSYGHAIAESCPYFQATDFLLADATCDGKKKMFELLGRIKPFTMLQLPQTASTPESFTYWLQELYRIKKLLEKQMAVVITEEMLWQQIRIYISLRSKICEVFALNKGDTPLAFGREIDVITSMAGFECNLDTRIDEMQEAIDRIHQRADDPAGDKAIFSGPRILLTGCPTTNKKVLHLIEDSGAVVVAMENCGSLKTAGDRVNEEGHPMESLARHYLDIACACMSPNPRRIEILGSLAREYRLDGVIEMTWEGCHTYNVEAYQIEKAVTEKFGYPYLHIVTDYSVNDTGQLTTRIEAFLEMLR